MKTGLLRASALILASVWLSCTGDTQTEPQQPLEVVPVGQTLSGAVGASHPDPWLGTRPTVAIDTRGRVYTKTRANRSIAVWTAEGEFVRELGHIGEGPGEFARGVSSFRVVEDDSLFVLDGGGRWAVFDSAGQYSRMFSAPTTREMAAHPLPDGRIVFTYPPPGAPPGYALYFTDRVGSYLGSAGRVTDDALRDATAPRPSVVNGGEIWIAPPQGIPRGLLIERRSLDGELVQELRFDEDWLPIEGYSESWLRGSLPDFKAIGFDPESGLLWVTVLVRDPWAEGRSDAEIRAAEESELAEMRFLAIDPVASRIVATLVWDYFEGGLPPIYPVQNRPGLFIGSSFDSLGLETIEFFRMAIR